jgi:CubicO group peptidase (beta-lactamase class C family)
MLHLIEQRIKKAIEEKVFPGCVVGIARKAAERTILPFGSYTYDNNAPVIKEDSIFDVASITKAIPTSSLALRLIDENKLNLDDRVIAFIPELRSSARERILVCHLLTQTLDFGFRLSDFKDKSPEEILDAIYSTELRNKPGETFFYTNATSILLGIVVERISGKCLATFADDIFFFPLGMKRTSFFPESFNREEIVPTEIDPWRGRLVQGEVHDESAFALRKKMIAGSAGLFSTVPDILTFLEMMLNDGEQGSRPFLSREILNGVQTCHVDIPGACTGLGWELCQRRFMGSKCSVRSFGKTGFTGCSCVVDPEKGMAFVLLSNYTFPKRKPDMLAINSVRRDCADMVFSL